MGAKYEKPKGYMPRVADAQIERYLKAFGAVEIAGTKWCGKTWSALMQGASVPMSTRTWIWLKLTRL